MSGSIRHSTRSPKKTITIIFGPQCSGKSQFFSTLQIKNYISLGEHVRKTDNSNKIKIQASDYIRNGTEWPIELGFKFIKKSVNEKNAIVLDGYPRNIKEYNYLTQRVPNIAKITFIEFTAKNEVLFKRFELRQREDKNKDFYRLRYLQYKQFKKDIQLLTKNVNNSYNIYYFSVNSDLIGIQKTFIKNKLSDI